MVVQLVYLGDSNYLCIKAIKPSTNNPMVGEITINCDPIQFERHESYQVQDNMMYTNSYMIPMPFIYKFLQDNGCIETGEDGKDYVVMREVEFKLD